MFTIENKKETLLYVVIVFIISWVSWGTLALLGIPAQKTPGSTALYMLGGLSTTLVALLLPLFTGRKALGAYYRRYFRFGISFKWYLIPTVAVIIMVYASYGLVSLLFPDSAKGLSIQPLYMVLLLFASMVIGGGLEEFGWRGIMVHNMRRSSPVLISIVVGVIWACWHIPLFYIKGVMQYHASFLLFFIMVIAYSFMNTILYLRTQSVIPCIIFHAWTNAFGELGFWYGNLSFEAGLIYNLCTLLISIFIFIFLSNRLFAATIKTNAAT